MFHDLKQNAYLLECISINNLICRHAKNLNLDLLRKLDHYIAASEWPLKESCVLYVLKGAVL